MSRCHPPSSGSLSEPGSEPLLDSSSRLLSPGFSWLLARLLLLLGLAAAGSAADESSRSSPPWELLDSPEEAGHKAEGRAAAPGCLKPLPKARLGPKPGGGPERAGLLAGVAGSRRPECLECRLRWGGRCWPSLEGPLSDWGASGRAGLARGPPREVMGGLPNPPGADLGSCSCGACSAGGLWVAGLASASCHTCIRALRVRSMFEGLHPWTHSGQQRRGVHDSWSEAPPRFRLRQPVYLQTVQVEQDQYFDAACQQASCKACMQPSQERLRTCNRGLSALHSPTRLTWLPSCCCKACRAFSRRAGSCPCMTSSAGAAACSYLHQTSDLGSITWQPCPLASTWQAPWGRLRLHMLCTISSQATGCLAADIGVGMLQLPEVAGRVAHLARAAAAAMPLWAKDAGHS